jgi:hypothetical protein
MMKRNGMLVCLGLGLLPLGAMAQVEGPVTTQTLVRLDAKHLDVLPDATTVTLQLNGKGVPLTSFAALPGKGMQIALLIDDGLSRSAGVQLEDLRGFASQMPPGAEVFVGYMRNGGVETAVPFTTERAEIAEKVRIPLGARSVNGSPYSALSELVKHWPGGGEGKARFVMMVTNGVDPYNGSTAMANQDSPYVAEALADAQRAGVVVSSVYYSDAGTGGRGSLSGQSYLGQVADGTGGVLYNNGSMNPVSLSPLFAEFAKDLSETYVATFATNANGGGRDHLVKLKMSTNVPKVKLKTAEMVRPGNTEGPVGPAN